MGQAQGYCCNDRNLQEKRRGEVRLYTKERHAEEDRQPGSDGAHEANEERAEVAAEEHQRAPVPPVDVSTKRVASYRAVQGTSYPRPLPRPIALMESHKKYALQSKLSSQDQNSLAGDVGFASDAVPIMPIAEMLESFKNHIEVEENEEANWQRDRRDLQLVNPDHTDAMINNIIKQGKKQAGRATQTRSNGKPKIA